MLQLVAAVELRKAGFIGFLQPRACQATYARASLLSSALGDLDYDSPRAARKKSKVAAYIAKRIVRLMPEAAQLLKPLAVRILDYARSRPEGPQKFATILSDMTQRLAVMDRYERRALSRRKFAIRAFDAVRASSRHRTWLNFEMI